MRASVALMVMVAAIPVAAAFMEWVTNTDISERHHIHHDTYSMSKVVTRTLVLVMLFMGMLGLLIGWLCHLGVFVTDVVVVLSFFVAFLATLLAMLTAIDRYRVMTYDNRLVVRPLVGPARVVLYDDIEQMRWVTPRFGTSHDLRIVTEGGSEVTLWGVLDVDQMLLRIDRFDALEP